MALQAALARSYSTGTLLQLIRWLDVERSHRESILCRRLRMQSKIVANAQEDYRIEIKVP